MIFIDGTLRLIHKITASSTSDSSRDLLGRRRFVHPGPPGWINKSMLTAKCGVGPSPQANLAKPQQTATRDSRLYDTIREVLRDRCEHRLRVLYRRSATNVGPASPVQDAREHRSFTDFGILRTGEQS